MNPLAVIVLVNGTLVPSAPPARLLFGHVMVPLVPIVTRFTQRASMAGDTIVLARGERTCTLRIGSAAMTCGGVTHVAGVVPFAAGGVAFVPLADVARAFGGAVAFDAATGTATVDFGPPAELTTPAPFDPNAPQVAPTNIFTPMPPPATPQPLETGIPHPRRTAIPATPSRYPLEPSL